MSDAEAVYLILTRWLQENDFKYLDRHVGFMQITTYAMIPYAALPEPPPDRPADSLEFRDLCRRLKAIRTTLGKALTQREAIHDALQKNRNGVENAQAERERAQRELERQYGRSTITLNALELNQLRRLNELATQAVNAKERAEKQQRAIPALQLRLTASEEHVATIKADRDRLEAQLDNVIREDSRLRLFITEGLVRPDTRPKAIMDAIRIIARNAFCRLLERFRTHYDNRRDDHTILRQLTRSSGTLQLKDGKLVVGLWHCATLPPATQRAIRAFLADLTVTINQTFPHLSAPIEITLLSTAPKL
jgi:seryl-tRNA synthetase